ncbi:uncharacterized protein LOC134233890 [Saccostrea cucullata]|uniref:uncharacterized protein LOC134233890 n=1 Tax=Saccostrea cuccullata TaxID=36930 RepID=UPI002ED2E1CF
MGKMTTTLTLMQGILFIFQILQICACPVGYKSRDDGTCCKTRNCSRGEGYSFCKGTSENPGEDVCFRCPKGTYNIDAINTADMPEVWQVCVPQDCSCELPGTIIENLTACEAGEQKICVCDRSQLRYGLDPMICSRVEDPKDIASIHRPGFELTLTGSVEKCRKGYYKPKVNDNICVPHQKCQSGYHVKIPGTTTTDNVCEEIPRERETTPRLPPDRKKNDTAPDVKVDPTSHPDAPIYVYVIIGAFVFVLLLLLFTFCVCRRIMPEKYRVAKEFLKRKFCTNTEFQPDNEEDLYEPLNIQEVNQMNKQTILRDERETGERGSEPEIPPDSLHGDLSADLSDVSTYVRQANIILDHSTPLTSYDLEDQVQSVEESSTGLDLETSLKTSITDSNSNLGVSVQGENSVENRRPIGRVFPSVREENQEGDQSGIITSPSEDDSGQLVPGGQRVMANRVYLVQSPGSDDQQSLDLSELGVQRVGEHSID